MQLAPEQIDRIVSDDPTPRGPATPSDRFYRHLYFAHFVLGEPWMDSFQLAAAFHETPLSVTDMHHIAEGWADEG